jgi:metal-dependent HD superfamily phosphatase/phosphodiesterase
MTAEAGVVRVADALEMTKGRSHIPFEAGVVNIHSLSAASIEQIEILSGEEKPIHIKVRMNNSMGVFQLDELLKEKLRGSGLEQYLEVEATIEGETGKKLVQMFTLSGRQQAIRRLGIEALTAGSPRAYILIDVRSRHVSFE